MKILSDIGGTHVRFATYEGGRPENIRKYAANRFKSFENALTHYLDELNLDEKYPLRIATAAFDDSGLWRFVNENSWIIDIQYLIKKGWIVEYIMNDFEASTLGLQLLKDSDLDIIHMSDVSDDNKTGPYNKCLIGPGTGLGLGYLLYNDGQAQVQWTHGAHMPLATITDEQWLISQTMKRLERQDLNETPIPVFEDVISGPGLHALYRALCVIDGIDPKAEDTRALFAMEDNRMRRETFRLFHEFLGLFIATVTISGHAYDGLYITGGVMDQIIENDLLDVRAIQNVLSMHFVASVRRDLGAMPLYYVREQNLALLGLTVYQ